MNLSYKNDGSNSSSSLQPAAAKHTAHNVNAIKTTAKTFFLIIPSLSVAKHSISLFL